MSSNMNHFNQHNFMNSSSSSASSSGNNSQFRSYAQYKASRQTRQYSSKQYSNVHRFVDNSIDELTKLKTQHMVNSLMQDDVTPLQLVQRENNTGYYTYNPAPPPQANWHQNSIPKVPGLKKQTQAECIDLSSYSSIESLAIKLHELNASMNQPVTAPERAQTHHSTARKKAETRRQEQAMRQRHQRFTRPLSSSSPVLPILPKMNFDDLLNVRILYESIYSVLMHYIPTFQDIPNVVDSQPSSLGCNSSPPMSGATSIKSLNSVGIGSPTNLIRYRNSQWLLLRYLTVEVEADTLYALCVQHGDIDYFYYSRRTGVALCHYQSAESSYGAQNAINNCLLKGIRIAAEMPAEEEVTCLMKHLDFEEGPTPHRTIWTKISLTGMPVKY